MSLDYTISYCCDRELNKRRDKVCLLVLTAVMVCALYLSFPPT